MPDPDRLLGAVEDAIDALIASARPHDGLFPSIIDRGTGRMARVLPPNVPGQRDHDRAHRGCNPLHDEPTLRAMVGLAERRPGFAVAADRYLERFATECTDTATGLFPWGEHAYWHLEARDVGDSFRIEDPEHAPAIHDHLRQVPRWVWARIDEHDPDVIHRFADGLSYHWNDPEEEYVRHAPITEKGRYPVGERACDFPRHGGFYVFDWAVAHTREPHPEYRRRIERMLAYWWERRDPAHEGLLRFESRGRTHELSPNQTGSLALSLLDAAALLEDHDLAPDLVERLREYAGVYLDGFLAAPHDPEAGVFLGTCRERDLEAGAFEPLVGDDVDNEIAPMGTWAAVYGSGGPVATVALRCLGAYRHTSDERLLAWAEAAGEHYRRHPFPAGGTVGLDEEGIGLSASGRRTFEGESAVPVRAGTAGQVLGLFADLHDLAGGRWLEDALDFAADVREAFLDGTLPRGAATVEHYEAQLGTGYLLHNLARVALLARGEDPLGPDYTDR